MKSSKNVPETLQKLTISQNLRCDYKNEMVGNNLKLRFLFMPNLSNFDDFKDPKTLLTLSDQFCKPILKSIQLDINLMIWKYSPHNN